MTIDLSFLTRWRNPRPVDVTPPPEHPSPPADPGLEVLERVEAALAGLTDAVARIAKAQFQMTALVESQAETLEEAVEQITAGLTQRQEREERESDRESEQKALTAFLREFLPVVDGLDRVLAFVRQNRELEAVSFGPSLIQALAALADRTRQALAALGVTRIPTVGASFDPYRHHAVKAVPAADPGLADRVVEEVVAGYEARGRIVRHASVVVAVDETVL